MPQHRKSGYRLEEHVGGIAGRGRLARLARVLCLVRADWIGSAKPRPPYSSAVADSGSGTGSNQRGIPRGARVFSRKVFFFGVAAFGKPGILSEPINRD